MLKVIKKTIKRFFRLVIGLCFNIIYLFSQFFPRNPNIWLFSAWNGKKFLDNPKHIFLHVIRNHPEVSAIWISSDYKLVKKLKSQDIPAVYIWSFKGIWYQLIAGVIFFSHSVAWDFWAPLIAKRVFRVQTWHGIPIKHIGFDDQKDKFAKRDKLISYLMPYLKNDLNLITAASHADEACYKTAFRVTDEKILLTGYARNDALLESLAMHKDKQKQRLDIIYMPTFRGSIGSEFQLFKDSGFNFSYFDKLCGEKKINLWIKLHPVQIYRAEDLKEIDLCKNIQIIDHKNDNNYDIYEEIGRFDILITDFSGIYFDFLITGKPVIMAPIKMMDYIVNDRELYYEYNDICPDDPCLTWCDVFQRIDDLINDNLKVSKKYLVMQRKFHKYLDNKSASRVFSHVRRITINN